MMKLKFILFTVLMLLATKTLAADIVYPKNENVTINSPVTFFIGSEDCTLPLTINSEPVEIHNSGGFYHTVKLNTGENIFKIDNGKETKTYIITRPEPKIDQEKAVSKTDYKAPVTYLTNSNNVPLRSTPYDGGINRLQNLEKNIPLNIIGEYDSFYKVQLARDDYAWIDNGYLTKAEIQSNNPAKIQTYTYDETPQKRIFTLKLNKKVPYILSETNGKGLDLVVYNIDGFPENKFEFHINETGKKFGYKSYYKNNCELIIEVKSYPHIIADSPLKGLTVTVDAGHGGDEFGAIGCLGDKEKDINLAIAKRLQGYLTAAGANVIMTRENDIAVSLTDRVKISQKNNTDIFLSIHNNALPDSMAELRSSGTSVYYFYPQSKALAKSISSSLISELSMCDDKVRQESFAVIRNTESPSILIEIGYMINPEDNSKLISSEFQDKAALAILHGLEKYLIEH